jgi:hypothetical protein
LAAEDEGARSVEVDGRLLHSRKPEQKLGEGRTVAQQSGEHAMTKLVVIGVALAVLILDVAPAFAQRGYYRGYGYGYYGGGYRAYGYYGRPYRYFLPAELHRQYDRNSTAFNS